MLTAHQGDTEAAFQVGNISKITFYISYKSADIFVSIIHLWVITEDQLDQNDTFFIEWSIFSSFYQIDSRFLKFF